MLCCERLIFSVLQACILYFWMLCYVFLHFDVSFCVFLCFSVLFYWLLWHAVFCAFVFFVFLRISALELHFTNLCLSVLFCVFCGCVYYVMLCFSTFFCDALLIAMPWYVILFLCVFLCFYVYFPVLMWHFTMLCSLFVSVFSVICFDMSRWVCNFSVCMLSIVPRYDVCQDNQEEDTNSEAFVINPRRLMYFA